MVQQTLVVIKPDGVKRNLIGKIISYYEQGGLKIIKLKMLTVGQALVSKHYPMEEDYLRSIGEKSAKADPTVTDLVGQGRKIVAALQQYITSGPVVAMILEGEEGIALARKITGYTDPTQADKGTVRGDLGQDSILKANSEGRPVQNLIHASGNLEEAKKEIDLWFPEE